MSGAEIPPMDVTKVIPSEEIIQYLHPSLLHLDYTSKKVQCSIIGLTLIFYILQFCFFLLICTKFRFFTHLSFRHRVFMSLAMCRGVFGICGSVSGGYSLFKYTNLDRDVVFGNTATSSFATTYAVGFFIFEVTAVIVSDIAFKSFSKLLLTHPSMGLVCFSLSLVLGTSHNFGCRCLALEMSTPFSCFCFILLNAKMESSRAWKINQLVLIHTFHLRSVLECYLWYITYWNWEHIWNFMPKSLMISFYFALVLSSIVMTPYWAYKKSQQLFHPVDWNFQESKTTPTVVNDSTKKNS